MTYTMFDQVFWRAISGQINRWRKHILNIDPTTFDKLEQHKGELVIPMLSAGNLTRISAFLV